MDPRFLIKYPERPAELQTDSEKDPIGACLEAHMGACVRHCACGKHLQVGVPASGDIFAQVGMHDNRELSTKDEEKIRREALPGIIKAAAAVAPEIALMRGIKKGFERLEAQNAELKGEIRELKEHIACLPPNGGGSTYRRAMLKFKYDGYHSSD